MLQLCGSARTCVGNHESESAKLQILLSGLETGYCALQFCSPAGATGNDKSKLAAERGGAEQSGAQQSKAEKPEMRIGETANSVAWPGDGTSVNSPKHNSDCLKTSHK